MAVVITGGHIYFRIYGDGNHKIFEVAEQVATNHKQVLAKVSETVQYDALGEYAF